MASKAILQPIKEVLRFALFLTHLNRLKPLYFGTFA
jgi:hypothetical protein